MWRKNLTVDSFRMRTVREVFILGMDLVIIALSFFVAVLLGEIYIIRSDVDYDIFTKALYSLCAIVPVYLISLMVFRVEKVVWRYAKGRDYARLFVSMMIAFTIYVIIDQKFNLLNDDFVLDQLGNQEYKVYPVYAIFFVTSNTLMMLGRMSYELLFAYSRQTKTTRIRKKTLILGGGQTASTLLEELSRPESLYNPICILDDDKDKIGRILNNVEIMNSIDKLEYYVKRYDINTIIYAIPSASSERRKEILNLCAKTNCSIKVLPFFSEMVHNVDMMKQMRDINIEDLLGRESVSFDNEKVSNFVKDKVCMVTGGGGSIGSELCRQIMQYKPKKLIILDVYENSTYNIQQELLRKYGFDAQIFAQIISITDRGELEEVFKQFNPEIIFHAAAHKHVPLMESEPVEAVKNNVFGTLNVVELAAKYRIKKFIMISTDKAVNPTNVMGATKRCCERIIEMMSQSQTDTTFAAVRFGNVLGSNGSVIPLFESQIKSGGPVTVTHPDMIRYFMTIPEAVSLVLQAGALASGGEIFILNMGDPVKIKTLAENLIRMTGHTPGVDIEIKYTGLRPGEKLYEELLMAEEGLRETEHAKIKIGKLTKINIKEFRTELEKMREITTTNDKLATVEQLKILVPTFKHDKAMFDAMNEKIKS